MKEQLLFKAKWWEALAEQAVRCQLCPRQCRIAAGETGFCRVRANVDGALFALSYGFPAALQVDPIEKKPLNEFLSGTATFSLGTFGCNLDCAFCQNHHLSRGEYVERKSAGYVAPETIVKMAEQRHCQSVAFTYNEPTVFAEYAVVIATAAKKKGLATVLVSNGYITLEAARELYPLIDAANIDMKGFAEEFYRQMCGGRLQPVLDAIKYYFSLGRHLELTNLVIPGRNDAEEMLDAYLDWVEKELDRKVPLHFSAYHPDHRFREAPRTPRDTLSALRERAGKRGFKHVYLGNI